MQVNVSTAIDTVNSQDVLLSPPMGKRRWHKPRLALPLPVPFHGSTISCDGGLLVVKLIKTGAKVVRHARYVIFQMAEVAVPRKVFAAILARTRRFAAISPKPVPI